MPATGTADIGAVTTPSGPDPRAPGYVRRLVSAGAPAGGGIPAPRGPVEPLSARELEVLRLLGTDLDGPGIARHLFVSLNTLRTHTKNLYAKLGVNSRRAAVRRGEELNLLARTDPRSGRAVADR